MNFTDYCAAKRAAHTKKGLLIVPGASDMKKRWNERITPRGLHTLGEQGAEQYLSDYGRGIGAPKCIALALQAEVSGYPALARGFWKRAYELETGQTPDVVTEPEVQTEQPSTQNAQSETRKPELSTLFPPHLAPGHVVTMQPVDAPRSREFYIESDDYYGQPKRDGNRLVIGAEPEQIWYQARSTNLRPAPSISIEHGLQKAEKALGPFVLDGELYYPSVTGSEHRTGAQAATANIEAGHGDVQPKARYAIFKALFFNGYDLTQASEGEGVRLQAGQSVAHWLIEHGYSKSFECLPVAITRAEKRALVEKQHAENREGEVWIQRGCRYIGGKTIGRHPPIVRTKYLVEFNAIVLSLTPTTAAGRPFGALEIGVVVGDEVHSIGNIGTGFDTDQMREIVERHAATNGQLVVQVASQGFTESGQVWHGRFMDFSSNIPADCLDPRNS